RGAAELTARLYGVGPVTGLALTCWLGGAGRFSSSRKAVRFAGLDITVYSSDGKRSPGHLSRQGPEVLRSCLYEAGKAHARTGGPAPARERGAAGKGGAASDGEHRGQLPPCDCQAAGPHRDRADGLERMSGRNPPPREGTQYIIMSPGTARRARGPR